MSTVRRLPSVMWGHRRTDGTTATAAWEDLLFLPGTSGVASDQDDRARSDENCKKKKSEGCQVAPASSAPPRSLLAYFGMPPAASPIKARQSRSVPGGGPARIPDEPGSSTGIRGKVGLPVSGVARVWLLRGGTVRRDGPPPLGRALQNVVSFAPPIQPRPFEGRRGDHAGLKAPSRTPPALLPLTERLFQDINAMTDTGLSWPTFLGIMNVSLPAWTAASMVGSGG